MHMHTHKRPYRERKIKRMPPKMDRTPGDLRPGWPGRGTRNGQIVEITK